MSEKHHKNRHFVFLDRDGVINVERGDYTLSVDKWLWAPGALEGILLLTDAGFNCIVITNQSCVAKGLQTEERLNKLHDYMVTQIRCAGGDIFRIYYCPHQQSDYCTCRKPEPGLLLQAARDYDINLSDTFFIGDDTRDIEAGRRAGTRTILINISNESVGKESPASQADFQAIDLLYAAHIVISETTIKQDQ